MCLVYVNCIAIKIPEQSPLVSYSIPHIWIPFVSLDFITKCYQLGALKQWRRKWQPTLVFLPGKFHGQSSLGEYSPWGCERVDLTERPNNNKWITQLCKKFLFCCYFCSRISCQLERINKWSLIFFFFSLWKRTTQLEIFSKLTSLYNILGRPDLLGI